jgi:hypothetical protein
MMRDRSPFCCIAVIHVYVDAKMLQMHYTCCYVIFNPTITASQPTTLAGRLRTG